MAQVYDSAQTAAPALGPAPSMNTVNELRAAVTGLEETEEGLELAEGVELGVGVAEEVQVATEVLTLFEEALPAASALGPAALGMAFAGVLVVGLTAEFYQVYQLRDETATFRQVDQLSQNLKRGTEILAESTRTGRVPTDEEIAELNTILQTMGDEARALESSLVNHPHVSQTMKDRAAQMVGAVDNLYETALQGPLGLNLEPLEGGLTQKQQIDQALQEAILQDPTLNSVLLGANTSIDFRLTQSGNGQFGTEFVITVPDGATLSDEQIERLTAHAQSAVSSSSISADITHGVNFAHPEITVTSASGDTVYESPRVEQFFQQTQTERLTEPDGFTYKLYQALSDPTAQSAVVFDVNGGVRVVPAAGGLDETLNEHGYPRDQWGAPLGSGVSGTVYPFDHPDLGPLALELQEWLPSSSASDPTRAMQDLDKILRETFIHQQASQITNNGVPIALPLHDVIISGNQIVSVIDRADGTLENSPDFLDRNAPLQLESLANVADMVALLHEGGFSHGDIKLDNILYTNDGGLYLSDFGLSKDLNNLPPSERDRVLRDDGRSFAKMIAEAPAIAELGIFDQFKNSFGVLSPELIESYQVDNQSTDWQVQLVNLVVELWRGDISIAGDPSTGTPSVGARIDAILEQSAAQIS